MPHRGARLARSNEGVLPGRLDQAKHATGGINQHRQLPQPYFNRSYQHPTPQFDHTFAIMVDIVGLEIRHPRVGLVLCLGALHQPRNREPLQPGHAVALGDFLNLPPQHLRIKMGRFPHIRAGQVYPVRHAGFGLESGHLHVPPLLGVKIIVRGRLVEIIIVGRTHLHLRAHVVDAHHIPIA